MAKDNVIVLRGELNYPKIVGDAKPHRGLPKYDKGPGWAVDLTPDAASRKLMKQFGIDGKLRDPKGDDPAGRTESFLSLKVLENRSDGKKNPPPKITTLTGKDWGNETLIGNGTTADVKIKVVDYGAASDKGTYLQAVRVLKHVPYEGGGFAPLSEDDEYFGAAEDTVEAEVPDTSRAQNVDDLDDDVPF